MISRVLLRHPRWLLLILAVLGLLLFLALSDDPNIWPLRNVLLYRTSRWWSGPPAGAPAGSSQLHGCLQTQQGAAITDGLVLVARSDGMLHQDLTDAAGCYRIAGLPAGSYVPLAAADGHSPVAVRRWGLPLRIGTGVARRVDMTLPPISLPPVAPPRQLQVGSPITLSYELPYPSVALRRQLSYDSGGRPNELTYLYTPADGTGLRPALLAVYPGPADQWEGVSIELAAAGYAVVAVGPPYTMDLEHDIAELQRLVALLRAGLLPGADGRRIAVLGGSYSSLHVAALLQRDSGFRGVVLLGSASDLFDLRRRFEEGSFFPPFGLDQALIALGWPNTSPERYWRYSAIYHLRRDLPPILLMHSRSDEIIPYQQSEQLAAGLARLGVPHEAHFFDGMSHYLNTATPSPDLTRLYEMTTGFLQRTLATAP